MASTSPAFQRHDHAACRKDVLAHADRQARRAGLRLTPVRRRVLEILLESHHALGAYEVLARLTHDGFANQPPLAYRALDFLCEQGLAHKVRRLNAYTACMQPDQDHRPVFLICHSCHAVAETPAKVVTEAMQAAAAETGFVIERMNLEALGQCPACQAGARK